HVIDKVTPEMRLFREESFGPVVAITRARDEEHAIELANDTEYGLSASVFTRDVARGLKVARRIQSGICHVNGPTVHDEAQMTFGGMHGSGCGGFGGEAGRDEFTGLRCSPGEAEPGHDPSEPRSPPAPADRTARSRRPARPLPRFAGNASLTLSVARA